MRSAKDPKKNRRKIPRRIWAAVLGALVLVAVFAYVQAHRSEAGQKKTENATLPGVIRVREKTTLPAPILVAEETKEKPEETAESVPETSAAAVPPESRSPETSAPPESPSETVPPETQPATAATQAPPETPSETAPPETTAPAETVPPETQPAETSAPAPPATQAPPETPSETVPPETAAPPETTAPAETVPPETQPTTAEETRPAAEGLRVWIGDSRMTGVRLYVNYDRENDRFIDKEGEGFIWFRDSAVPQLKALLAEENVSAVYIWMGVNDCASTYRYAPATKAADYSAVINELTDTYPNVRFFFCSVGPSDGEKYFAIEISRLNEEVDRFNAEMAEMCRAAYIACGEYLQQTGFSTQDGIHYTLST